MKVIEVKNPMLVFAIARFITSAIGMERCLEVMTESAPPEKQAIVEKLGKIIESMIPLIDELKAGEIPAELEKYINEAKEAGEIPEIHAGVTPVLSEAVAPPTTNKSSEEIQKEEEDDIEAFLDQIDNNS